MLTLPDTNEDQKVFGPVYLFLPSRENHQGQDRCGHGSGQAMEYHGKKEPRLWATLSWKGATNGF
jgi:hypothetical protein